MKHRSLRAQRGLTLIEVLVAILIFSFGLLGFVGLQARAIQFSVGAEDSNRAALLANEMATTMLMLKEVNVTNPNVAAEIVKWQTRTTSSSTMGLPNAEASATSTGNVATLTITWRANSVAATAPNATNRYVTQVILAE
ncbi:MAG: type IV pilus modification protein PilV [Rhizobiales bacterium]|nr:type IV pilus modification protein PilV [Rhizobacter sp.]